MTDDVDAEFLGQEGLAVTGKARMEAAYGSGDGDEKLTAQVAQTSVVGGAIFEQKYRPWRGELNPRWMRNWSILRHHLLGIVKKGHKPWGWPLRVALLSCFFVAMADLSLAFLGTVIGDSTIYRLFGVSRGNLYGHVLGFFPRNAVCFPIITALLIGGMISDDRRYGTSAVYFSRPINRRDYTAMKFISIAVILGLLIVGTLVLYYVGDILMQGEGWAWLIDTFPAFLLAALAGSILVFTYTSIGLALSSVSQGRFFPAVAFLAIILGSKLLAFLVWQLFERSVIYLISPYDVVAHIGQSLLGLSSDYSHPWTWSLVSVLLMNAAALYVLTSRISSMEVSRE
jgi:ABC-type transport system involved in multi-copper enzyme maturation permease subunit